jgi:hypothetical protein
MGKKMNPNQEGQKAVYDLRGLVQGCTDHVTVGREFCLGSLNWSSLAVWVDVSRSPGRIL